MTALAIASIAAAPVAARPPIALGLSNAASTDMAAVDAVTASMGVAPATWTLWSSWGDRGGQAACSEGVGSCAFPRAAADGLRERGVTPLVYWQPTDPGDPGAGRFERYRTIIEGRHDRYIRAWARSARDYGKPVIVRFAHEMNGTWFPWSLTNFDNTPGRFQEAWRHIVRLFRQVGADNVAFLWSPFQTCSTCAPWEYEDFYPGNAYVDYVGVTALNWGDATWTPLDGLLAEPLTMLRRLTRTPNDRLGKPVILPETGSNHIGGDKAAWIRDGYRVGLRDLAGPPPHRLLRLRHHLRGTARLAPCAAARRVGHGSLPVAGRDAGVPRRLPRAARPRGRWMAPRAAGVARAGACAFRRAGPVSRSALTGSARADGACSVSGTLARRVSGSPGLTPHHLSGAGVDGCGDDRRIGPSLREGVRWTGWDHFLDHLADAEQQRRTLRQREQRERAEIHAEYSKRSAARRQETVVRSPTSRRARHRTATDLRLVTRNRVAWSSRGQGQIWAYVEPVSCGGLESGSTGATPRLPRAAWAARRGDPAANRATRAHPRR